MEARYILGVALCLFAVHTASAIEWIYEFGEKDIGEVIYDESGIILPFSYKNDYPIPVPPRTSISYVKVTVNSLSPPKVDFDEKTSTVSITFSFTQLSAGTYHIQAKGEPIIGH